MNDKEIFFQHSLTILVWILPIDLEESVLLVYWSWIPIFHVFGFPSRDLVWIDIRFHNYIVLYDISIKCFKS